MEGAMESIKPKDQQQEAVDAAQRQVDMLTRHLEIMRHLSTDPGLLRLVEDAIADAQRHLEELSQPLRAAFGTHLGQQLTGGLQPTSRPRSKG